MIDAGIGLCGGCGDSSDPEQLLLPAWACTDPSPFPGSLRWSLSNVSPAAASPATDVLHFGFLPLPALLVLKLKASVCELVAVLQDPN